MIEVIRAGQFTTIQDLGRFGYRSIGVPVSGPMDRTSAALANQLLDNDPNDALIEMAYVGASFLFHKSARIAYAGASCDVQLNGETISEYCVMEVKAGTTLSFGAMKDGNFAYLAIVGGFKPEEVLGSSCYYQAVNGKSRMAKGTYLFFDENLQNRNINLQQKRVPLSRADGSITVEKGPEFHLLPSEKAQLLMDMEFSISPHSNRMGFLLNEGFENQLNEIISSPVQAGTIQLTKGGQLIVLMRDAQTVGGYPRLLQLTEKSIDVFCQIPIYQKFQFTIIED